MGVNVLKSVTIRKKNVKSIVKKDVDKKSKKEKSADDEKSHDLKKSKDKCCWNMGSKCKGTVYKARIFDKQITVPMCQKHLNEHRIIMSEAAAGKDVNRLLDMSSKERETLLKKKNIKLVSWDKI